jgi:hypothetical protein
MSIQPLYIATLDVLGFKNLIDKRPLDEIVKMYQELLEIGTPIKFSVSKESSNANNSITEDMFLMHTVFSDSMIIWTEPTKNNINYFVYFLSLLMGHSILKQLPLRFGIAYGECEMDISAQIFVGRPIVDTYQTESNQEWIGGAFHKSCYSAPYFDLMKGLKFALPYDVPIKEEKEPKLEFAVNWVCSTLYYDRNLEGLRSALIEGADKAKQKYKKKWLNTLHFIDSFSGRPSVETI